MIYDYSQCCCNSLHAFIACGNWLEYENSNTLILLQLICPTTFKSCTTIHLLNPSDHALPTLNWARHCPPLLVHESLGWLGQGSSKRSSVQSDHAAHVSCLISSWALDSPDPTPSQPQYSYSHRSSFRSSSQLTPLDLGQWWKPSSASV